MSRWLFSFRAALDPRVRAVVCFFAADIHNNALGKDEQVDTLKRCGEIKDELIITMFLLKVIRRELRKNIVEMTFIEINDAQHAFERDEMSKGRYDSSTTKNFMKWLFEMFNRKLKLG